jgi:hypothetical protein
VKTCWPPLGPSPKKPPIAAPGSSPLISCGQNFIYDEPIDGLDIHSIEPYLIAKTILDYQDDTDDITLTREELAQMFEDFASISDEELDALCSVGT